MDICDDIFPPSNVTRIRTDTFAYVLLKPKWDCVNIKLTTNHSLSSLHSSESRGSANRSPLQLLKWSFQDKNELIVTIGHFGEVKDHLLGMVRFFSLASAIGVDLRHLQHLRTDQDARELGLHDDSSLALIVSGVGSINESFDQ